MNINMNLNRILKIKKLNGELDNITDVERSFLSILDGDSIVQYNCTFRFDYIIQYYKGNTRYLELFVSRIDSSVLWLSSECCANFYRRFNCNIKQVTSEFFKKYSINIEVV